MNRLLIPAEIFVLLFLFHHAYGKSASCSAMDPSVRQKFEEVFHRGFMGCRLTPRQSMIAMSRANWIIPAGSEGVLDIARRQGAVLDKLDDIGMEKKEKKLAMIGLKLAGLSFGRKGMLTVSTECIIGLEPDFVASLLATSRTPKDFNGRLREECKKKGLNLDTSSRNTKVTITETRYLKCVYSITETYIIGGAVVSVTKRIRKIKKIVDTITITIPCPSNAVRAVA